MTGNTLTRSRRRFGWGAMVAGGLAMAWWAAPGLPVWRAPRASADTRAAGRSLFEHEWEPADALAHGDGLGPVFNARSCAACHFQGGIGGGGGNDHNVMAFEAMPTKDRPEVEGGLIHKFAVANTFLEDHEGLRRFYPIVPGGLKVVGNCQILTRDLDPIRTESVNSTALFGAGWVDRISARSITHQSLRKSLESITAELGSKFDGIPTGRYRVLPDGRVGKFGWKGQFASLEEFVAAACANEVGLGNPMRPQAKPRVEVSYPDVAADLDRTQFGSLVAFVATLDRPVERLPEGTIERDQAARGSALFRQIGCAHCHTPDMGGVVGVYSDFLLHSLDDRTEGRSSYGTEIVDVPLPAEHPRPDEWKTPTLWGVADSAPYFHDGHSPTLEAAILRHDGGAASVTKAYKALPADARASVVAFLGTLRAPGSDSVRPSGTTALASSR